MSATIYWFKNDQRLLDNEALCAAIAYNQLILPIYIVDPRHYELTDLGHRKADFLRFKFLKQSLLDLNFNLKELGAALDIKIGYPEEILPQLAVQHDITRIYTEEEYAYEECAVLDSARNNLPKSCTLVTYWGKTMYHIKDIPYTIEDFPKTSKTFRINTSKKAAVRPTFKKIIPFKIVKPYNYSVEIEPKSVGFKDEEINLEQEPFLKGGETAALERLKYYTIDKRLLSSYKATRNLSIGLDYSSKLSAYLALGNLSPRTIYEVVKTYEDRVVRNRSTWWLIFEVVWRDYFTFRAMHHGNAIFQTSGFKEKKIAFENNVDHFTAWKNGVTGIPFVDAHMRQLNTTGYMSNRGRVNCASFLVHDLKIDWTWGASYFESKLIDYDVAANWMNWHMQAYEIWYTNPVNQALKYSGGAYIKKYIPELRELNENEALAPWLYENNGNYPDPIVMYKKWSRAINLIKKKNNMQL